MFRIATIVGARPQFVKAATVSRAIASHNESAPTKLIEELIVHTGQHYDENMSALFFQELDIPQPTINLSVGSDSHGKQTAKMLSLLDDFLTTSKPACVLVYGDTNSTLAGALAAVKLHIPVVHVESGLRAYNRNIAEEVNRVVADYVATLRFCPSKVAVDNLQKEGITEGVLDVGDVMYDSVLHHLPQVRTRSRVLLAHALESKSYYLATIHRAENTEDPKRLYAIISALSQLEHRVILPLHPRTKLALQRYDIAVGENVEITPPVGYLDMLVLESNARIILTDSGGMQKEAYWLHVPCITMVREHEWEELFECGCNKLCGAVEQQILKGVAHFETPDLEVSYPPNLYGDGHAAEYIVNAVCGGQE